MNLKHKKGVVTAGSARIAKTFIKDLISQGVKNFAVIGKNQDKLDILKNEFEEANFILVTGDFSTSKAIERFLEEISKH